MYMFDLQTTKGICNLISMDVDGLVMDLVFTLVTCVSVSLSSQCEAAELWTVREEADCVGQVKAERERREKG